MRFKLAAKRFLPLVYFLIVSLPHHPFSKWFDATILNPLGVNFVQRSADVIAILLIVVAIVLGIRVVRIHRKDSLRIFGTWCILLILIAAADRILIVNNIERIHFPQYAVLSLILGLSIRNPMLIFTTSSYAGFVDELLQYVMRPDRTHYLDFNDIVLNMLGAAFGVALLIGLRRYQFEDVSPYEKYFRNVVAVVLLGLGILVLTGIIANRFIPVSEQAKERSVVTAVDGKLSFIMSFEKHEEFWEYSPAHGKAYHVMSPIEGVAVIAALTMMIWLWMKKLGKETRNKLQETSRAG